MFKRLLLLILPLSICFNIQAEENLTTKFATLPPVPNGWSVDVVNQSGVYTSPLNPKTHASDTKLTFTYTKATNGNNALQWARKYIIENHCKNPVRLGYGFYSVSCPQAQSDVIFVGEPDNIYTIAIEGEYTRQSVDVVNNYLTSIINGKRTFKDRNIGENVEDPAGYDINYNEHLEE